MATRTKGAFILTVGSLESKKVVICGQLRRLERSRGARGSTLWTPDLVLMLILGRIPKLLDSDLCGLCSVTPLATDLEFRWCHLTRVTASLYAGSDDDRPSFGLGFDQKARAKPAAPRADAASESSRTGPTAQAEAALPTPDFSVEYEGRPVEATTVTVNLPATVSWPP